jgi:hypothetical protein
MNYFREILAYGNGACGGSGRYATLQKDGDGDDDMWRENLLCEDEPSLPPVPLIIQFDLLQMNDERDEYDDEENLVGLAFVEDTKHEKPSFEAFTETEDPDSVELSIEDLLLSTWSSFPSLSTDDEDDSYNNWNKSPVRSFDDGSSYATRIDKKMSNLFVPLGAKRTTHVSPKKELSQGTMTTASSRTTFDSGHEYGEI